MSFFGFDSSRHNTTAPGFSQAHDPFAGLSNRNEDDDALDFEDTYDGLGDQLDETDDAFNDDTFGDGGAVPSGKVGKDFGNRHKAQSALGLPPSTRVFPITRGMVLMLRYTACRRIH